MDEKIKELTELHDTIKEHPYWKTFKTEYLDELLDEYHKMINAVYGSSDNTNPYYVLLNSLTHDMNCLIQKVYSYKRNGFFEEIKDDTIMILNNYLMNMHNFILGHDDYEHAVGYLLGSGSNPCGTDIRKLKVIPDKNGEYKVVSIITKKNIPPLKKWLKKRSNLEHTSKTKEWAIECLKDIEENKQIIGGYWKVE